MHPLRFVLFFVTAVASQKTCFTASGTSVETVPGAFPHCNSFLSRKTSCDGLMPTTRIDGCVCQQDMFDLIYECRNDFQECLDSRQTLAQWEYVVSEWHKECDTLVTFNPTTPASATLTTTFNTIVQEYCLTIVSSACYSGAQFSLECKSSFPHQTAEFLSCACKEPLISLASVCEYDGNKTCGKVPAALTNIDVWTACPEQASSYHLAHPTASFSPGSSGILPALPSSSTGSLKLFSSSAMPGGKSTGQGPQTTSSKSFASAKKVDLTWIWVISLLALTV